MKTINKLILATLLVANITNIANASDLIYDFHGVFNTDYKGVGLAVDKKFHILDNLNLDIGSSVMIGKTISEQNILQSTIGCRLNVQLNNNLKAYGHVFGFTESLNGGYYGHSIYSEYSYIVGIQGGF